MRTLANLDNRRAIETPKLQKHGLRKKARKTSQYPICCTGRARFTNRVTASLRGSECRYRVRPRRVGDRKDTPQRLCGTRRTLVNLENRLTIIPKNQEPQRCSVKKPAAIAIEIPFGVARLLPAKTPSQSVHPVDTASAKSHHPGLQPPASHRRLCSTSPGTLHCGSGLTAVQFPVLPRREGGPSFPPWQTSFPSATHRQLTALPLAARHRVHREKTLAHSHELLSSERHRRSCGHGSAVSAGCRGCGDLYLIGLPLLRSRTRTRAAA